MGLVSFGHWMWLFANIAGDKDPRYDCTGLLCLLGPEVGHQCSQATLTFCPALEQGVLYTCTSRQFLNLYVWTVLCTCMSRQFFALVCLDSFLYLYV